MGNQRLDLYDRQLQVIGTEGIGSRIQSSLEPLAWPRVVPGIFREPKQVVWGRIED